MSLNIKFLYPVILSVPPVYKMLTVRQRVKFLSQYARQALLISEQLTVNNYQLSANKSIDDYLRTSKNLPKDKNGIPLPVNGWHWSLTHKPEYVGAVACSKAIGFDLETIKPYSQGVAKRIATDQEWSMIDPELPESFFRYWTAKEAVLKTTGAGLTELSKCKISRIIDSYHLEILYRNKIWLVEHFLFNQHLASIVKNDFQIRWIIF